MIARNSLLLLLWWMVVVALVAAWLVFGWTDPALGAAPQGEARAAASVAVKPEVDWAVIPPAPSADEARFAAAVAAYRSGDLELALKLMPWRGDSPHEPRILDAGVELWKVLLAHRSGDVETAERGWKTVALLPEAEIVRHLAAVSLALHKHDDVAAAIHLGRARHLNPDHPLVHYYLGLVYLNEASSAHEWNDAIGPTVYRLAAFAGEPRAADEEPSAAPLPAVVPNSASMYRRAAREEFELAIETARDLNLGAFLVGEEWTIEPALRPTLHDALLAFAAARFVPNCHNVLAGLSLAAGNPELAEEHLDRAYDLGAEVLYGYRDLAELYEETGRDWDALRAYDKARTRGLTGEGFNHRVEAVLVRIFSNGLPH